MTKLTPRLLEIVNRNSLSTLLLKQGYNIFLPTIDDGIDFIAYREDTDDLKIVQQKSRWTIHKKYLDRRIWIAFPDGENWYLAPHRELFRLAEKAGYTSTIAWNRDGTYHMAKMSKTLKAECERFRLDG